MNSENTIQPGTFAEACFDQNSIAELQSALDEKPDKTDMGHYCRRMARTDYNSTCGTTGRRPSAIRSHNYFIF
jgi:hypothetical protein